MRLTRSFAGAERSRQSANQPRTQIGIAPIVTIKHTATSMTKEDGMFGLSTEIANSVANWTYLIAGGLAVLFTATTVAASFVMWKTSTEISDEKDRQLSRFQAEAKERTASLEKEAARANERAANAYKAAEDERAERLKLELKLAPRSLGKQEQDDLASKLGMLSGVEVDIVSYEYLGTDIAPLTHEIAAALESAGSKPAIFTPLPGAGWVRGILVRTLKDAPQDIADAANNLVSALLSVGLDAGKWEPFQPDEPIAGAFNAPEGKQPSHKIRVLVGSKP